MTKTLKDEANRLVGCRKMDDDTFEREVLMSLENFTKQKELEAAERVISRVSILSDIPPERRGTLRDEMYAINGTVNDYLRSSKNVKK